MICRVASHLDGINLYAHVTQEAMFGQPKCSANTRCSIIHMASDCTGPNLQAGISCLTLALVAARHCWVPWKQRWAINNQMRLCTQQLAIVTGLAREGRPDCAANTRCSNHHMLSNCNRACSQVQAASPTKSSHHTKEGPRGVF
jgi:hypothetical protein